MIFISYINGGVAIVLLGISLSLVIPACFIGATLVYFDLRVRKEGYTLERLEAEIGP